MTSITLNLQKNFLFHEMQDRGPVPFYDAIVSTRNINNQISSASPPSVVDSDLSVFRGKRAPTGSFVYRYAHQSLSLARLRVAFKDFVKEKLGPSSAAFNHNINSQESDLDTDLIRYLDTNKRFNLSTFVQDKDLMNYLAFHLGFTTIEGASADDTAEEQIALCLSLLFISEKNPALPGLLTAALFDPKKPVYYDGEHLHWTDGLTPIQVRDSVRDSFVDIIKREGGFGDQVARFLVQDLVHSFPYFLSAEAPDGIPFGGKEWRRMGVAIKTERASKQDRDKAFGPNSVTTARIEAYIKFLGTDPTSKIIYDESTNISLLDRSNQIHKKAKAPNASEEDKNNSMRLTVLEADMWVHLNGDQALYGDKEKQLTYYLQAQEASMTSLDSQNFKTRLQIAQGMAKDAYWKVQQLLDTGATSGVDVAYYKQFSDYLEKNGEAFAKTNARGQAVDGKPDSLLPSEYNAPATRVWNLEATGKSHYVGQYPFGRHVDIGPDKSYIVTIVETNGRLIAIHPDGEIHKFKNNNLMAKDGTLNGLAIIGDMIDQKIPSYAVTITGEKPTYVSGKTTKDIAEEVAHKGLRTAIDQFKEANYSATAFQKFLSIIPFYDTISGYSNDPLWQPDTASIVLDSLDAMLTIGSIGAATIGKAGLTAIQAATKGLSGAAKAGKILSMAATQLLSKKGALKFAREITDFVLPVFTARDIIAGVAKAGVAGKNALMKALKGADSVQEIVPTAIKTALPSVGSIPPQYRDIQIGQSRPWQGPYGNDSLLVTRLQDTNEVVALKSQGGGSYRQVHWETGQALSNTPLVYKDKAGNFIRAGLKGGSPTRTIPLIFSQQEINDYQVQQLPRNAGKLFIQGFANDVEFYEVRRNNTREYYYRTPMGLLFEFEQDGGTLRFRPQTSRELPPIVVVAGRDRNLARVIPDDEIADVPQGNPLIRPGSPDIVGSPGSNSSQPSEIENYRADVRLDSIGGEKVYKMASNGEVLDMTDMTAIFTTKSGKLLVLYFGSNQEINFYFVRKNSSGEYRLYNEGTGKEGPAIVQDQATGLWSLKPGSPDRNPFEPIVITAGSPGSNSSQLSGIENYRAAVRSKLRWGSFVHKMASNGEVLDMTDIGLYKTKSGKLLLLYFGSNQEQGFYFVRKNSSGEYHLYNESTGRTGPVIVRDQTTGLWFLSQRSGSPELPNDRFHATEQQLEAYALKTRLNLRDYFAEDGSKIEDLREDSDGSLYVVDKNGYIFPALLGGEDCDDVTRISIPDLEGKEQFDILLQLFSDGHYRQVDAWYSPSPSPSPTIPYIGTPPPQPGPSTADGVRPSSSKRPRVAGGINVTEMPPELTNGSGNFWRSKGAVTRRSARNLFRDGKIHDVAYGNGGKEINGRFNYKGREYRFFFSGGMKDTVSRIKNPKVTFQDRGKNKVTFQDMGRNTVKPAGITGHSLGEFFYILERTPAMPRPAPAPAPRPPIIIQDMPDNFRIPDELNPPAAEAFWNIVGDSNAQYFLTELYRNREIYGINFSRDVHGNSRLSAVMRHQGRDYAFSVGMNQQVMFAPEDIPPGFRNRQGFSMVLRILASQTLPGGTGLT